MCTQTLRQTTVRILAFCLVVYGSSGMIFGSGPLWLRIVGSLAAAVCAAIWILAIYLAFEMVFEKNKGSRSPV